MSLGVAALVAVLAAVALVVTALNQLHAPPGFVSSLKARDHFSLLPRWTFFAPNPGVHDTRLLWRERLVDGSVSHWHELVPPATGPFRGVWNPTKRVRKAITDAGPMIARRAAQAPDNPLLVISVPFLMLLHYATCLPGSPAGVARQFVVVRTAGRDEGDEEPQILLVSNWHSLRPEHEAVPVAEATR